MLTEEEITTLVEKDVEKLTHNQIVDWLINVCIDNLTYLEQIKKQEQIIATLRKRIQKQTMVCGAKATERDIIEANSYNSCIADIIKILDKMEKKYERG